jgi:hypothetical protein
MPVARVLATVFACSGALALWAQPAAAAGTVMLRPTTPGSSDAYSTPEAQPYVSARAVVHYVTSGPQAPPATDANANGIPDYVEQVGAAADTALQYYEQHGFRLPAPDGGGPDAKPDIYIDTLPKGVLGFTFAPASAEGGTFVIVAPTLDTSPTKPSGSVDITVAHELFHVIQFSYVTSGKVPVWAAEGSAAAMSMLVFPQVQDQVMTDYLDAWLKAPWLPLYDERSNCVHCYGGAWWWLYLAAESKKVLPAYFAKLAADDAKGVSTRVGVDQLDTALKTSKLGSLFQVFTRFSLNLYRRGLPLGSPFKLTSSTRPQEASVRGVFGLSTQYVPIRVPAKSSGLIVSLPSSAGPAPDVSLVLGGPHGRRVVGKRFRPGQGVIISTLFRSAKERRNVVLIVTSGTKKGARYSIQFAALRAGQKIPQWIAWIPLAARPG